MGRDFTAQVKDRLFDLLVIGGGIQGAALCWRAAAAGLTVALVEREDFGGATSANSQKVIHGGLRYLQSLDIPRTLESIQATRHLLRLAPHLVRPMPCLMPLYGYGPRGREAMALGLTLYNLLRRGANREVDPARRIAPAMLLSPRAARERFALLPGVGLRGAALWHDARCENTERLTLAFVRSAQALGAMVANHVEAGMIERDPGGGNRIALRDRLGGGRGAIRARNVARCTGPWLATKSSSDAALALGINLVTPRLHAHPISVALREPVPGGGRMYFVVPWRGNSIVGTAWLPYQGHPEKLAPRRQQILALIADFNRAWPGRALSLADVRHVHAGLVPCQPSGHAAIAKEPRLLGHERWRRDPLPGGGHCLEVHSVKYTTAATVAEKALRRLYPGRELPCGGAGARLIGGEMPDWHRFYEALRQRWDPWLATAEIEQLAADYGTEAEAVLDLCFHSGAPAAVKRQPPDLVAGKVRFAVRHEMAQTLADAMLRRTGLGSAGAPARSVLERAADIAAEELGWDHARRDTEIRQVLAAYPDFIPRSAGT